MDQNKQDGLIWVNNKDNMFVNNLSVQRFQLPNWPWKSIQRTKAPVKAAWFGWIVTWEACLTQDKIPEDGFCS